MRRIAIFKLQTDEHLRSIGSRWLISWIGRPSLFLFIFFILHSFSTHAQAIKVSGRFNGDSIEVGKPVEFYLSVHHPENINLLFPDSSFFFTPFEFSKKKFFTTQTKNGISTDSAIYFLTSYEIDSIQKLRLPIFVLNGKDSTQLFSESDSVYLKHLVKSIPDSVSVDKLPLKANTNYLDVKWQWNYFLLVISSGILVLVLVLIWVFFGKRIKKYFKLKRLTKGYETFLQQYENSVDTLQHNFSIQQAEGSLLIWKKYLESLLDRPYTKFTSKEIQALASDEKLGQSLGVIDRMIYGGFQENHRHSFDSLKDYVHNQYEKKKAEVANG